MHYLSALLLIKNSAVFPEWFLLLRLCIRHSGMLSTCVYFVLGVTVQWTLFVHLFVHYVSAVWSLAMGLSYGNQRRALVHADRSIRLRWPTHRLTGGVDPPDKWRAEIRQYWRRLVSALNKKNNFFKGCFLSVCTTPFWLGGGLLPQSPPALSINVLERFFLFLFDTWVGRKLKCRVSKRFERDLARMCQSQIWLSCYKGGGMRELSSSMCDQPK